jgi:O-antigen/teichoic acid export membrane protein
MVAGAFFLFPVVVRVALPDFTPAIPVVHIVVAGSFFLSLTNMPIKMLMTAGYRWTLASLMLVCLAFNAAVNYTAVGILDKGLKGAAVATAISYFAFFAIVTVYALSRTQSRRQVLRHVAGIVGVFAYLTTLLWAVDAVAGPGTSALSDTLIALAKLAVVTAALTPFAVIVERRYGALGEAKGLLTKVRHRGGRS